MHTTLVGGLGVLEDEWHGGVAEGSKGSDEGCLDLIFYSEWYMIISQVRIEEAQEFAPGRGVHVLNNAGAGQRGPLGKPY